MASAQDSVAFLTALSTDGSVDGSVPPLAVYTGENIFGRDDCHVFGKKISRKHLRLTAWSDEREDHFDVYVGDVQVAILSNYMVDVDWILSECPLLRRIPVIMIHGERGGSLDLLNNRKSKNWVLYQPPLPISFGTHHSKAMLLLYETGLRVVVHTANLIHADWNNKTQGLWMQDFPRKTSLTHRVSSGFEEDLVEYLTHLKWEGYTTSLPSTGPIKVNAQFFRTFDFSSATVRLVASVPGYHRDRDISKFGHMKMLQLLKDERFDSDFVRSPLVFQFSSLGSINEQWIDEMRSSMSAGKTTSGDDLGIGEVSFVWPTVEDIRCSLEGYAAGNSVPSPQKNVKAVQKSYWAKWRADHCGRGRAMPHIKTYARYNGQTLAWFLLTSSNLSKAAWGSLQKQNSQLMIRSYELGVLFLPSTVQRAVGSTFSCTGNAHSKEIGRAEASTFSENEYQQLRGRPGRLVTTNWEDDPSFEPFARLPVPYSLPPPRYGPRDVPWSWDCVYTKPDIFGEVWPRDVQFYAAQGPM